MDQGGRLEGVAGRLGRQPGGGELPQLVVDEREQLGRGLRVAGRGRVEESGDVGHVGRVYPAAGRRSTTRNGWAGSRTLFPTRRGCAAFEAGFLTWDSGPGR